MSEENYLSGLNAGVHGGDEISFTNMGLVAETVLAQVCVRLVSSLLVGWPAGLVLEAWWPAVRNSRFEMATVCVLLWRVHFRVGRSGGRLALLLENVKKCGMS